MLFSRVIRDSMSRIVGWMVGRSVGPSVRRRLLFYFVSSQFKSFYIFTFRLLVLMTARGELALLTHQHEVINCSHSSHIGIHILITATHLRRGWSQVEDIPFSSYIISHLFLPCNLLHSDTPLPEKQGLVADGWAGSVMKKTLVIPKFDGRAWRD